MLREVSAKSILELRGLFGEESISTDDEDLHAHGFSSSSLNITLVPSSPMQAHKTIPVH